MEGLKITQKMGKRIFLKSARTKTIDFIGSIDCIDSIDSAESEDCTDSIDSIDFINSIDSILVPHKRPPTFTPHTKGKTTVPMGAVPKAPPPSVLLFSARSARPFVSRVNVDGLLCGTSIESIESKKSIESIESVEYSDSLEFIESILSIEPIESIEL